MIDFQNVKITTFKLFNVDEQLTKKLAPKKTIYYYGIGRRQKKCSIGTMYSILNAFGQHQLFGAARRLLF